MHSVTIEAPVQPLPEGSAVDVANSLNFYSCVEDSDMRRLDDGKWGVHVYTAYHEDVVPASKGTLIRYTNKRNKFTSYSYIDSQGRRMMLDQNVDFYPNEVGARILGVQRYCSTNNVHYEEPPLTLQIRPEVLREMAINSSSESRADYRGRHVSESRIKQWARKIGKFFVRDMLTEEEPEEYKGAPALAPINLEQAPSFYGKVALLAPALPRDIVANTTLHGQPKAPGTEVVGPLPRAYDTSKRTQLASLLTAMQELNERLDLGLRISSLTDLALDSMESSDLRERTVALLGRAWRQLAIPLGKESLKGNQSAQDAFKALGEARSRLSMIINPQEYRDYGAGQDAPTATAA